jgi:hypothetical protein
MFTQVYYVWLPEFRSTDSLQKLTEFIGSEIEIKDLDNLSISHGLVDFDFVEERKEDLIDQIQESRLSEEQKDYIYDLVARIQTDETSSIIDSDLELDPYKMHLIEVGFNLSLYATVIRNNELIRDTLFKRKNLKNCARVAIKLFYAVLLHNSDRIQNMEEDELLNDFPKELESVKKAFVSMEISEMRKQLIDNINVLFFGVFQRSMSHDLGTPRLRAMLDAEISARETPLSIKLLCTMMYMDLGLKGYVTYVEEIAKSVRKNSYYQEVLCAKIKAFLATKNLTSREFERLVNVLADALMDGSINNKALYKSRLVNDFKRKLRTLRK